MKVIKDKCWHVCGLQKETQLFGALHGTHRLKFLSEN